MADFWKYPSDPTTMPMLPLRGMYRNVSPGAIPDFGHFNLKNYWATQKGLKRRPGYQTVAAGSVMGYTPQDMALIWDTTGNQVLFLITEILYSVGLSALAEVLYTYTTGTVTAPAGTAVTGSGTVWNTLYSAMPGDLFRIGSEEKVIDSITDATHLVLKTALANSYGAGTAYTIVHTFGSTSPLLVDWVVDRGKMIFADGKFPLIAYDADTAAIGKFITAAGDTIDDAGAEFTARCVAVFQDRVLAGFTEDVADGTQRQRIRHSDAISHTDFSAPTAYIDLPYSQTGILRMLPMSSIMPVYFGDAIYIGIPNPNYPDLPIRYEQLETGGIGLTGPKAVCAALGGQFFVGQDDFYFMSNRGPEKIGTAIARYALKQCQNPERIYAVSDAVNSRVLFGLPRSSSRIETIWSFDTLTKEWSYEDQTTWMIANPLESFAVTIDDLTMTIDNIDLTYPSIDRIGTTPGERKVYIENGLSLWSQGTDTILDFAATAIAGEIETKDYDLGVPDDLKMANRLALKIVSDATRSIDVSWVAYGSTDCGRSWKLLGNIVIGPNDDEGYVDFRLTGSSLRFKLTSSSAVEPYTIVIKTLRARKHGREAGLGNQKSV